MSHKRKIPKCLREELIREQYNLDDAWVAKLPEPVKIEKDKSGKVTRFWTHQQVLQMMRPYPFDQRPDRCDPALDEYRQRKPRNWAIYEAWLARRWRRCAVLTREFLEKLSQQRNRTKCNDGQRIIAPTKTNPTPTRIQ